MFPSIANKCSQSLNTQPNVLLPWAKPTASARCVCPSWVKSRSLQSLKHVRAPDARGLISVICTISADIGLMSLSSSWLDQHWPMPNFLSGFGVIVSSLQWNSSLCKQSRGYVQEWHFSSPNKMQPWWLNYRRSGCCREALSRMKKQKPGGTENFYSRQTQFAWKWGNLNYALPDPSVRCVFLKEMAWIRFCSGYSILQHCGENGWRRDCLARAQCYRLVRRFCRGVQELNSQQNI